MSLFNELKRRNVFKVGAGYVVIAWLAIQVGTSVLPIYGTPDWFLRAFVLVLLLGFPVALVLAWLLEVTPEGVKVDSGPVGNKRMYAIAAVLAALALGWYFHGMRTAPKADLGDARSIAVLPFVNMSGDKNNEYFSDGVSEEILNVLAEIPELKVAARTSSFSFRGSKEEVPQIAHQLGVRMVLEGSVRKQGDRVRITAQLIDSSTGFHVWSQTYDRELKDIFAIQDEIAKSIGEELKLRVAGEGKVAHRGTENLQAYDLYLRGLAQWQIAHRGQPVGPRRKPSSGPSPPIRSSRRRGAVSRWCTPSCPSTPRRSRTSRPCRWGARPRSARWCSIRACRNPTRRSASSSATHRTRPPRSR